MRFALAGILVLIFASLRERKVLLPDRTVLKYAVVIEPHKEVDHCGLSTASRPYNGYSLTRFYRKVQIFDQRLSLIHI